MEAFDLYNHAILYLQIKFAFHLRIKWLEPINIKIY